MTLSAKIITAVLILWQLIKNLFLFVGVPAFALRAGRPISYFKFTRNMLVYVLCGLALNSYGVIKRLARLKILHDNFARLSVFIYLAGGFVLPVVFGFAAFVFLQQTNRVDEFMPKAYRALRPVEAVVVSSGDITRVEYRGKEYVMNKDFPLKKGSSVKVRIFGDENNAFLA